MADNPNGRLLYFRGHRANEGMLTLLSSVAFPYPLDTDADDHLFTTATQRRATHNIRLNSRGLSATMRILGRRGRFARLPLEIIDQICSCLGALLPRRRQVSLDGLSLNPTNDPYIPIAGKHYFQKLPPELLRMIVAESLPAKNIVVKCQCGPSHPAKDPERAIKRTVASDLMTLRKNVKDAVKEVIYRERTFAIHVHQGMDDGGIEILDAGRQPLHYQENSSDDRFTRFTSKDEFGFRQLKKIQITIFPSEESVGVKVNALNTYYTNLALVRLLERDGGKKGENRMTSISIIFAEPPASASERTGRRGIMNAENYWWDQASMAPKSSAIHNITDIEMCLRPFSHITGVHNVNIHLPVKAQQHEPTATFVNELVASMKNTSGLPTISPNDRFDDHMDVLRNEVEEYVFRKKYGDKAREISELTAEEMTDDFGEDDRADFDSSLSPSSKRDLEAQKEYSSKRRKIGRTNSPAIDEDDVFGHDEPTLRALKDMGYKTNQRFFDYQHALLASSSAGNGRRIGDHSSPGSNGLLRSLHADRRERDRQIYAGLPNLGPIRRNGSDERDSLWRSGIDKWAAFAASAPGSAQTLPQSFQSPLTFQQDLYYQQPQQLQHPPSRLRSEMSASSEVSDLPMMSDDITQDANVLTPWRRKRSSSRITTEDYSLEATRDEDAEQGTTAAFADPMTSTEFDTLTATVTRASEILSRPAASDLDEDADMEAEVTDAPGPPWGSFHPSSSSFFQRR